MLSVTENMLYTDRQTHTHTDAHIRTGKQLQIHIGEQILSDDDDIQPVLTASADDTE